MTAPEDTRAEVFEVTVHAGQCVLVREVDATGATVREQVVGPAARTWAAATGNDTEGTKS